MEFLPKPGQARGVQIDLDPTRIGLRYPVEVGLVGDCQRTLQALLPLLQPQEGPLVSWRSAQKGMEEWGELMEEQGTRDGQADEAASGGARVRASACATTPSSAATAARSPPGSARHIPARRGQMFSLSGIAGDAWRTACRTPSRAQIAYPDRQVRRVRRRRRLFDADGRVRHRREIQAADQGHHHQEQLARA